ncbi:hypothetical protein B0J12DRAFT_297953 [Macrophomina phaseolina]|uniref:Uncharacterized protein n=1 Tax=Macrophomina phaseolina TaxID=35725 RepID=A0ABQ8GP10_9PEZI|nr:hypothetical protein B0J12DRAFT_297953 [Macrophomina phaseolina]
MFQGGMRIFSFIARLGQTSAVQLSPSQQCPFDGSPKVGEIGCILRVSVGYQCFYVHVDFEDKLNTEELARGSHSVMSL